MLGGLGKFNLLFADAHVLYHAIHGSCDSNAKAVGLQAKSYGEEVRIGHSRRRHACGILYCLNVGREKFRKKSIYLNVLL